jgi:hypothetical protein
MRNPAPVQGVRPLRPGERRSNKVTPDWSLPWAFLAKRKNDIAEPNVADVAADHLQVEDTGDGFAWRNSNAFEDRSNSEGD